MSLPCLFVAEKPSIAKILSETLSQGSHRYRAGPSQYNPNYDFDLNIQSSIDPSRFTPPHSGLKLKITVTSVSGHLMSIDFENKATKNWRSTPQREMFDAKIERFVSIGSEPIAQNLANEAHRARVLVIWTDCDREGENIGEEIAIQCQAVNPHIIVRRAVFSAANQADLWRAVNTTRELDMKQVEAVNARQEIDLRLGAVFTRFQTLTLGDAIAALDSKIVSFGPCQFPTLGFIVARYESILSFQIETCWMIKLAYESQFHFNWQRYRLFDHTAALICFEQCVQHPECTVVQTTRRSTTRRAPIPLSTVEFQIRASKWLKLDSEVAMKAAESLYQRGIISYPRTETEQFSPTFDLHSLIQNLTPSPLFGEFAARLCNGEENLFLHPRPGPKDDQAHPPIHPLRFAPDLHDMPEIRVYEFVCRHFLACCAKDAMGFESTIKVQCAGEFFTIKGLQVMERNYLDVYVYDKWGERSIPHTLVEGSRFFPSELNLVTGHTSPPELLTEGELIRLMDKHGIGTDATIADHIKTVQEREYASKTAQGNRFAPSNLGVALIRAYNAMGHESVFSKPALRSQMERDLKLICLGQKTKHQVVLETITKYKDVFADVLRKRSTLKNFVESVFSLDDGESPLADPYPDLMMTQFSICGKCGQQSLELRKSSSGKLALRCPCCDTMHTNLGPLPSHTLELTPRFNVTCPLCHFQVIDTKTSTRTWCFCPYCFVHPPSLPGDIENPPDVLEMPCFKCKHAPCPLSGGTWSEDPLFSCPECAGANMMELKRHTPPDLSPTYFSLRCKGYPACKYTQRLPSCVKSVEPAVQSSCAYCHAKKLIFRFVGSKVPPGTPAELTECPNFRTCFRQSMDFKTILEMENMSFHPPPPSRGVSTTTPQSSRQQTSLSFQPRSATPLSFPPRPPQPPIPPRQQSFLPSVQQQPASRPPPTTTRPQAVANQSRNVKTNPPPRATVPASSSSVPFKCKQCNLPVIERTATTQANAGRSFTKCEGCSFFEWKDSAPVAAEEGIPCYHCGNTGHFPVQCPQNSRNSSFPPSVATASSSVCFKCQQPGHWASQCKISVPLAPHQQQQQQQQQPSSVVCFKCKQPGHFANNCQGAAPPPVNSFRQQVTPAPPANKNFKRNAKPRMCSKCKAVLPPRKRKCEQCGTTTTTATTTKKVSSFHEEEEEFED